MSERIQLRRTRGWRKPTGVVVVARPGPWGNPVRLGDQVEVGATTIVARDRSDLAHAFRLAMDHGELWRAGARLRLPSLDDVRAHLAGRDLACWCPLDAPCHADVLLEIANG